MGKNKSVQFFPFINVFLFVFVLSGRNNLFDVEIQNGIQFYPFRNAKNQICPVLTYFKYLKTKMCYAVFFFFNLQTFDCNI
jgi:hypothetical protein